MGRQYGPWTIQGTTLTYHNPFLEVHEDQVTQPDGQPGLYATITMSPGVAVLPVDDAGDVYLTRQFRYALGHESLEVVSGATEADEAPLEAARRELGEELGIAAGAWTPLGRVDPTRQSCTVRCGSFWPSVSRSPRPIRRGRKPSGR
jgi:hypothetical protein